MSMNGESHDTVAPMPRPLSFNVNVIEGMAQDEDGNIKAVKMIRHTIFHENGMDVHFYPVEFCALLLNALTNAYEHAKSPLTIAKDFPKPSSED